MKCGGHVAQTDSFIATCCQKQHLQAGDVDIMTRCLADSVLFYLDPVYTTMFHPKTQKLCFQTKYGFTQQRSEKDRH